MFPERAYNMTPDECFTKMIRVSTGSAMVLGLMKGNLDASPTTVYLLTYRKGKCNANCAFCPQAKNSKGRDDMLSRVTWPSFPTVQVVDGIGDTVKNGKIKRVCIQALNYPAVFHDVLSVISSINSRCTVPVSVSCQPISSEIMKRLAAAGVERIGVPLDAANEEIFDKVKGKHADGPYDWNKQLRILENAVKIFGKGNVTTHLIAGLGETEKDMIRIIQRCIDTGVYPGLFAFTPIPGTALESSTPPTVAQYRRIQLAGHLIIQEKTRYENMRFDNNGRIVDFGVSKDPLHQIIITGLPFVTSGCPNCNRPYYNEKPSGPLYNYPFVPTDSELEEIEKVLEQ
jgi:biotin synthase